GTCRPELRGVMLEEGHELVRASACRLPLRDVLLPLAGEPVEAVGRIRRRRRDRGRRDAPLRAGTAREGVRAASGTADRDVAFDPERVDDILDVRDDIRDGATGIRRRAPVAGAVVADHPETTSTRELDVRRKGDAAAGRPVVLEDDTPVGVARVVDVERPA